MASGKDSRLSIGRFARFTGLSIKTLRYYDEAGILKPSEVDPHSGYRYYARDQVLAAYLIRRLKWVGSSIEDIHEIVNGPTEERLRDLYERSVRETREQILDLTGTLRMAERMRDNPVPHPPGEVESFEGVGRPFVYLHHQGFLLREIEDLRAASFVKVRSFLARNHVLPASPPTTWAPPRNADGTFEMFCGFEVTDPLLTGGEVQCGLTPSGRFYRVRHYGLYEHLNIAMYAVRERLHAEGLNADVTRVGAVTSEVYLTGPWDTNDAGGYCTDFIWTARLDEPGILTSRPDSHSPPR